MGTDPDCPSAGYLSLLWSSVVNRPCLGVKGRCPYGELTQGTRCPRCQRQWNAEHKNTPARRAFYGPDWQRHSRERRAEQPWCQACGSTAMLSVDHPTDAVLCKRCHGELEARRRAVA